MQVVFQDAGGSLTPTMTVAGLLRDTRAAHGRPASRDPDAWAPLLATVGLDPALATRYPHELSGGQRQRVALARALALDPELLVLDEPLSALDVPAQLQMLDLLASLKAQRHLTILLITHHLDAARRLADEVAVMYAGRIVETGPAALVLSAPAHPYTRALLAALPGLDPAQPTLAATPPAPSSSPPATGCDFSCRCPYADEICRTNRPALTPLVRKGEHVRAACHYPFNDTDRPLG
jgi:oligopeptide/dipeptide ABC transporter ATP-binding protein